MRRYRNLSLRLPQALLAELEIQRARTQAPSLTAVIQRHLELQLAALPSDSAALFWRRQNRTAERSFFSLRPELVDQLERIAKANGASICDVALNLLCTGLTPTAHLAA